MDQWEYWGYRVKDKQLKILFLTFTFFVCSLALSNLGWKKVMFQCYHENSIKRSMLKCTGTSIAQCSFYVIVLPLNLQLCLSVPLIPSFFDIGYCLLAQLVKLWERSSPYWSALNAVEGQAEPLAERSHPPCACLGFSLPCREGSPASPSLFKMERLLCNDLYVTSLCQTVLLFAH